MPAGQDLIFFDTPEDWEQIVSLSRTATIVNENSHTPIPPIDLGVSLDEEYIAVIAGTSQGKPSWQFAGDIRQIYSFSKEAGDPVLGEIQSPPTKLFINKLQIVETSRISLDNFRLQYTPPFWFKDTTIRVYKYIGDALNFVEDTLFDIGNALGINENTPEGKITLALAAIRDDIDTSFATLNQRLDTLEVGSNQQIIAFMEEIRDCACNGGSGSTGLDSNEPDGRFFAIS